MKPRIIIDQIKPYIDSLEAIIVTGMRRTGKTTLLHLISEKIESKNKVFLDLENPLNRKYFEADNYESTRMAFEVLGLDFAQKAYVFLDEIQLSNNLPSIVKYFIDHYQVKFFLTGSASFYLKNLFTESLAGRKFIFELHPLNFSEFLAFKEVSYQLPLRSAKVPKEIFELFAPLYEEYLLFGGFPGVVLKTNIEEKKRALEEIFSSFFLLEVNQLGDFRRNDVMRQLMLLLLERIGSKLDIQKISKELGVSRHTINEYTAFLEGTYFIRTIKPFSKKKGTEIRKMPKVYACDTGFADHHAKLDRGALFENGVFQNLKLTGKLAYYQKKSGVEIDFILNEKTAYEVKVSPQPSDLKRLENISKELGIEEYHMISKNYSSLDHVIYGFML